MQSEQGGISKKEGGKGERKIEWGGIQRMGEKGEEERSTQAEIKSTMQLDKVTVNHIGLVQNDIPLLSANK